MGCVCHVCVYMSVYTLVRAAEQAGAAVLLPRAVRSPPERTAAAARPPAGTPGKGARPQVTAQGAGGARALSRRCGGALSSWGSARVQGTQCPGRYRGCARGAGAWWGHRASCDLEVQSSSGGGLGEGEGGARAGVQLERGTDALWENLETVSFR